MLANIINNIIKLITGKALITASGTLFNTIDHPASETYCFATKNTPSPLADFHTFNVMLNTRAAAMKMLFLVDSDLVRTPLKIKGLIKDKEILINLFKPLNYA